ncbi:hypothetical protein KIF53_15700 [Chromobacterium subtsugae]|uniref:Uncharacterized protein n=1 Tax=Chromobacterium subtsugae TaxID=251747 RepID=A0ABS7FG86_9NEIS|nr:MULTISPECIES: hypothetical protein [Chromobacterium]KUM02718.1 hypothetical protein Cv017_01315 [Chromobacterium subtsugae]KZE84937.1 hypothetical protein AWB61_02865 [Chromobacterium sp. F49]MBW7567850.1 hypothetical protein [Chromobacterium subtsugae]MBW8289077.1 hypothetical protein [Chromobacterium subtsugae]OBU85403.1 hypothetical protein MY55_16435 [Chromobacterium subtsugae]
MLDSNFDLDEPLEAILQRPLTWFEKQQIQENESAPLEVIDAAEAATDAHPLRRHLKDLAKMQVIHIDRSRDGRPSLIDMPFNAEAF